MKKQCIICKKIFFPIKKTAKSCSDKCAGKRWRKNNKKYLLNYQKIYIKLHPKWKKNSDKKSYLKHRQKRLEVRKRYYENNKKKVFEANNKWRAKNKEKVKLYRHNRELFLKRKIRPDETITADAIKELNIFQKNRCNECDFKMKDKFTLDHLVPLNKKGKHSIYNIQLLCHNCNSSKQDKMRESDIQYSILQYLRLKQHFCWKNSTVGIYKKATNSYIPSQNVGSPDIFSIKDGKFYGIEVKSEKNKQTPLQVEWQKRFEKEKGIYILVRSLDDISGII